MTDKPTPEQIQRACDLANAKPGMGGVAFAEYGRYGSLTALADTIARLDAMQAERDRNQASRQYHKAKRQEAEAERDKARADLAEIDRIAEEGVWGHPSAARNAQRVAAIAAPYRVETDPLVEALVAANARLCDSEEGYAPILRAELAKRGLEIGRAA